MLQDYLTLSSPDITSEAIATAQANVSFFTRLLAELRVELVAERSNVPTSADALQTDILAAQLNLDQVQVKINREKHQIKRCRQAMDEWNSWYGAIAPINKNQAWETLNQELNQRHQVISTCEAKIIKLETQKLIIMDALEKKRIQLAALTQGLYDRPLEDDPRWIEAQSALNAARETLKSIDDELKNA